MTEDTKASLVGRQFGPFHLVSLLGSGGMGDVYRAHDSKLGRDVAIKTLPPALATDADRLARLEREARVLATLNHPKTAAVYGLEEYAGQRFIVMELVEGETLAELLRRRGKLQLDEALTFTAELAEALEAAHLKGIVHRDVKPANIKVTPEGHIKVLDFGLAKLTWPVEAATGASDASTIAEIHTESGRIMGTICYMSPEQARGKAVDKRTDVWALGCILYELLSGQKAFIGETSSDTLVAVLEREPRWDLLPVSTPPLVKALIAGCLRKDVLQRLADTRAVLVEIEGVRTFPDNRTPAAEAGTTVADGTIVPKRESQRSRSLKLFAAMILLAVLAVGVAVLPGVRNLLFNAVRDSAVQSEKHLAVLPFVNVGNDPANQIFCDGIAESLTTSLTQLERFQDSLLVVPSSEVRRQSIASVVEAQRAFGVNFAVTGSAQRNNNGLRLTVNLVDARTLRQVGARAVDVRREELSQMEDRLLDLVAELLDVQIQPQARTALNTGKTSVSDAYDAYLQGRGYLRRYDKTGNLDHAIASFQLALQRDSRYALAYVGLGESYLRTFDRTKGPEWVELAQNANARAIELNGLLSPAHVNLGMTYAASGKYDDAVREYQRALELDSLNPDAYRELGGTYELMNRDKDAEATYLRAIQLRPSDWLGVARLGGYYYRRGRYKEAEPFLRKMIELTPDNVNGYNNLGGLYLAVARYDDAEPLLKKSVQLKPNVGGYSNLGTLYFLRRQYAEAVRMYERAVDVGTASNYIVVGNLADSYRWAPGLESKALPTYRHAIELAEQQLAVNPKNAAVLSSVALYRVKAGDKDAALRNIARAQELAPKDTTISFKSAVVLELAGRRMEALAVLKQLLKGGYSLDQIKGEPELAGLRQDPGFARIVSENSGIDSHTQAK